jgi:7,8-dihydropterin-6-yl-methyl-4-(beta-D-ribofuranosyl)aminobenzene 5'-phosphate synthase
MANTIRITSLIENTCNRGGLRAEHGLAFHIQAGDTALLFDTGQSDLLRYNARGLGLDLAAVRKVALSHGHYDHTGGVEAVLQVSPQARFYAHPAVRAAKFTREPEGSSRSIGMPDNARNASVESGVDWVWTRQPTEIHNGIFVTGEIPRRQAFEDTGGQFYLDAQGVQADPLLDDQALWFDTPDGLVVLLACAHAGVLNTLAYIRELTSHRPVHTVVGGMHLLAASPERTDSTIAEFRRLGIRRFAPAHCTGLPFVARLWQEFPGQCLQWPVGTSLSFRI